MQDRDDNQRGRAVADENSAGRTDPLAAPKRRKPKQLRSKTTVDKMLAATVEILEHGSFEAITMLTIANGAGISIATAYSYFPNKHQVLAHLAQSHLDDRLTLLDTEFAGVRKSGDWIEAYCETLVKLLRLRERQPGSVALRQAMHASPFLWQIDQEGNRRAGVLVASVLRDMIGDDEQREIQGRVIAEYTTVMLDYLQRADPDDQPLLLDELVSLTRVYLRHLSGLDPTP